MCPAAAKTSDEEVVAAARRLVERDGAEALSMQSVATAIGVRAPSLYKRFPARAQLLIAVENEALGELQGVLSAGPSSSEPVTRLRAIARAYRRFAHEHPRLYALIFSGATAHDERALDARRKAGAPALDALSELVGPESALAATRVLTAFMHGFVAMESAGEFRLGPGINDAFQLGLDSILGAFATKAMPRATRGSPKTTRRPGKGFGTRRAPPK